MSVIINHCNIGHGAFHPDCQDCAEGNARHAERKQQFRQQYEPPRYPARQPSHEEMMRAVRSMPREQILAALGSTDLQFA